MEVIKKDLRNKLSDYRYEHSLRVADECVKLAEVYNIDKDKAYLTGLVHDIAKEFSYEENLYYINKYGIDDDYKQFKRIIHAYVGSYYLKEKYNMDDEIIKAVRIHNIADMGMSLLDKILFVADKIEFGKDYNGIDEQRMLAYKDIDRALMLCLENNYKKLMSQGKQMHPTAIKVLKKLKKQINQ